VESQTKLKDDKLKGTLREKWSVSLSLTSNGFASQFLQNAASHCATRESAEKVERAEIGLRTRGPLHEEIKAVRPAGQRKGNCTNPDR